MSIYEKIDSLIQRVEEYLEKSEPEAAVDEGEKTIQIFTVNETLAKAIDKYSTWGMRPKPAQSTNEQVKEYENKQKEYENKQTQEKKSTKGKDPTGGLVGDPDSVAPKPKAKEEPKKDKPKQVDKPKVIRIPKEDWEKPKKGLINVNN